MLCLCIVKVIIMFVDYLNYLHRIPNGSPELIFGGAYISKVYWVSLQGGVFSGGFYSGFYVIL